MDTYFDLISLPLSYLNFSHFSFLIQVRVFIQQFRHMWVAICFRTSKFWESISEYLTNCVYFDFAHGLYSIGALWHTYTKNVPRMRTWLLGHAYFILGELKVFAWNGVGSREWGKSLDFGFYLPNEMNIPLLRSSTSAMMILMKLSKTNSSQKPGGSYPNMIKNP